MQPMFRNALRLTAHAAPYTTIIEPWAAEYTVAPGDECEVVALHRFAVPLLGVEVVGGALVVTIYESGATYEFWRGGGLESLTDIPIPDWPPDRPPGENGLAQPGATADRG